MENTKLRSVEKAERAEKVATVETAEKANHHECASMITLNRNIALKMTAYRKLHDSHYYMLSTRFMALKFYLKQRAHK